MNNSPNSQNSVLTTAIIMMGFIVVTALVVRQGSIQITPSPKSTIPEIRIDQTRAKTE